MRTAWQPAKGLDEGRTEVTEVGGVAERGAVGRDHEGERARGVVRHGHRLDGQARRAGGSRPARCARSPAGPPLRSPPPARCPACPRGASPTSRRTPPPPGRGRRARGTGRRRRSPSGRLPPTPAAPASCRGPRPASTRIRVPPPSTRVALPVLPEPRTRSLTARAPPPLPAVGRARSSHGELLLRGRQPRRSPRTLAASRSRNSSAAIRCTSSAVTASIPESSSSRVNDRPK